MSHPVAVDLIFAIWVSSRPTSPASSTGTRPWTWTDRLKHPWVLNTLAWVVPVAVIVIESIFQAGQWRASAALTAGGVRLTTAMEEAAAAFNDKGMAGVDLPGLTRLGEDEMCASIPFRLVHPSLIAAPRSSLFNHFLKTQNRLMITLAVVFTFEAAVRPFVAPFAFKLTRTRSFSWCLSLPFASLSSAPTHHEELRQRYGVLRLGQHIIVLSWLTSRPWRSWSCGAAGRWSTSPCTPRLLMLGRFSALTRAANATYSRRHSLFEVSSVVVYWGKAVLVFLLGLLSLASTLLSLVAGARDD